MPALRYSFQAEFDLDEIALFTVTKWSQEQAVRYINQLEDCCESLLDMPELGRACEHISPSLRRIERGKHVIFYKALPDGILIVRVLHQRMRPVKRHFR